MISKYLSCLTLSCLLAAPFISSTATAAKAKTTHHASQGSAKALGVLMVLNRNEIAVAHLAKSKSHNKEVKHYADLMIKEHGKNLKKTEQLSHKLHIKPVQGPVAQKLQANGKKELANLKKSKGADFDKSYVDAMVKGHTEALGLIGKLENNTSNPAVKKHLDATKIHVEAHLQKATDIQKDLHQ